MLRAIVICLLSCLSASSAMGGTVSAFLRNVYNDTAFVAGGGLTCGRGQPETTLSDLQSVDCVTRSNYQGGAVDNPTQYLRYSEQLVLQDLAVKAEASAKCNLPMFDAYVKAPHGAVASSMNKTGFQQFLKVRDRLKTVVEATYTRRRQLDEEIAGRCGLPPSSICAVDMKHGAAGDFQKLDQYMAALAGSVSLGSAPGMRDALVELAMQSKPATEADFAAAYAPQVKTLDSQLHSFLGDVAQAKTTFPDKSSTFDFSKVPSVREKLITSPEYDAVLKKLGATSSVRQKLLCRRDAEFREGPGRLRMAELGLTILSMGLGVGEVAVVARAGEGAKAIVDASRGARMITQGAIAGADVALAAGDVGNKCFDTPTPIGQNGKCSVNEAIAGKIALASKAECGIAGLETALALIPLGKILKMDRVKQAAEQIASGRNFRARLEAEYDAERVVEGSKTRIAKPPMSAEGLAAPLNPRPLSASLSEYETKAALAPYRQEFGVTVSQVKQFKASLLEDASPAEREHLIQMFNKMVDRDDWSVYMEAMSRDARTMSRRQLLNRQSITRLLVKRAADRGETQLRTIENGVAEEAEFSDAIRHGFFDKAAANIRITSKDTGLQTRFHGMDTHLVQRDYISSVADKVWPGGHKAFFDYLARNKNGLKMFDEMFDKPGAENGTDPSYVLEMMNAGGLPIE